MMYLGAFLVNSHVKIQFEINSQHELRKLRIINLVNSHVKIQFEINSQPLKALGLVGRSCEFSRKNTI